MQGLRSSQLPQDMWDQQRPPLSLGSGRGDSYTLMAVNSSLQIENAGQSWAEAGQGGQYPRPSSVEGP